MESGVCGAYEVLGLGEGHFARITELMRRYEHPPMEFADACPVVAAEAVGSSLILSTDRRDFWACRWKERRRLKNLMALAG